MTRVLIVGGYGAFGTRVAERLAREPDLDLIIAGRDEQKAGAAVRALRPSAGGRLEHAALDATKLTANHLAALRPRVVINASGPFQGQDYELARACIATRCHYVDLADARRFVTGITALDADAKAAKVSVVSGASSVPGLSSAVVLHLKPHFARVDQLEICLSPGNRFNPGEATTRSVLSGAGQPIPVHEHGRPAIVYGWQGLCRRTIPGVGRRWFSHVDVPDLDLFPASDLDLKTVHFRAGLEVPLFHLGLWALAGLARAGLIRDVAIFSRPLRRAKECLAFLGSDRGGLLVTLTGQGRDHAPLTFEWSLVATHGHGPYIPAIASVILAKRLARGNGLAPGARPCFGLFTLDDFLVEVRDLKIETFTTVKQ